MEAICGYSGGNCSHRKYTAEYPSVLDIPLSDPDDASWKFEWPQEMQSIDDCYWFLKSASGGSREKDWYKRPKDATLLFGR